MKTNEAIVEELISLKLSMELPNNKHQEYKYGYVKAMCIAIKSLKEALEAKDKETVRAVEIATRNMEEAHREEMNKLVESVPKIFVPIDSCGKIEDINQEWREYKLNLLKSNE